MRCIKLVVRHIFLGSAIWFISISSANAAVFDAFPGFDGFDGKTLNYQYYYPNSSTETPNSQAHNGNKLVGAGIEVTNIVYGNGTMDIFNTGFLVDFAQSWTFDTSSAYNGFELADVFDDIPDFSAFNWKLTTNTGLSMDNVVLSASMIGINWKGLVINSDSFIQMEVTHMPVPAAIWLFGSALLGLVGMSRRTKAA